MAPDPARPLAAEQDVAVEPAPVIEPGHTFASITDKISAIVLSRRTPPAWFVGAGVGFALMVLGLSLVTALGGKSMVKALIMAVFGLLLGMVGMDPAQGAPRFTFGHLELLDGLDFVPVIMGLFGLSELLHNAVAALPRGAQVEVEAVAVL